VVEKLRRLCNEKMALADGQLPDNYHARQPCNRRLALGWILIPRFQGRG
jgi:hypothetical protein